MLSKLVDIEPIHAGQFLAAPHSPRDEVEIAISAIARGEFVLVVDDEQRENEGDLIIARRGA